MNEIMPTSAEIQAPTPNEMIEVPDWVRDGGPAPEVAEKALLSNAQKKAAGEAIKSTLGATDPAEKDPLEDKITHEDIRQLREAEAARSVADEATPSVDGLKIKGITVIDAQPKDPPKKNHIW